LKTGQPLRQAFQAELDQLRMQVEVMGVRVDQNLERMRDVLAHHDPTVVDRAINADDDIDDMNVSLTERCYDLLARENPVASDLRFIVSVLRILSELERIGDLSLRVVKRADEFERVSEHPVIADLLTSMSEHAVAQYRVALHAWSSQDAAEAAELASSTGEVDHYAGRLAEELLRLDGVDAVSVAMTSLVIGRSLDRIADHAAIIGARLRYLLSGDPDHLAAEVR